MRLSDLLGAEVVDRDGRSLGRVRDVRLVQDGPIQGTFGAGLRIEGLVVGRVAVASRLGYDREGVEAPWLVARIARVLSRDSRHVPWSDVVRVADRRVELACRGDELLAPTPLRHLPGAES
ncbi:MAG: PRC-barrel domain containing protein [Acidimicrobiales bacterium]|nr:PRC-barrel domain containing protein [Acidimicrobiales bacterium]